jgi:hypothetical protein
MQALQHFHSATIRYLNTKVTQHSDLPPKEKL